MTEPQPDWTIVLEGIDQAATAREYKRIWLEIQDLSRQLDALREAMDGPTRHALALWERAYWKKRKKLQGYYATPCARASDVVE